MTRRLLVAIVSLAAVLGGSLGGLTLTASPAAAAASDRNFLMSVRAQGVTVNRGECGRAMIDLDSYVEDGLYATVEVFDRFGDSVFFRIFQDRDRATFRPRLCASYSARGGYRVVVKNEADGVDYRTLRVTFRFRVR